MLSLNILANFIKSNTSSITPVAVVALARTFPELLALTPGSKDVNVLREIVSAVPRINFEGVAARTLNTHVDFMNEYHIMQLLNAGEGREQVLRQLLWLTVDSPKLTSLILERSNWSLDLIDAAYILGCSIVNSLVPVRKHSFNGNMHYMVMAMAIQPTDPVDAVNCLMVKHAGSLRESATAPALVKLASDPDVFKVAIETVKRGQVVTSALLELAAVPTLTNRDLADELLRVILEVPNVGNVILPMFGNVSTLNVIANPYVDDVVIKMLKSLAPWFEREGMWDSQDQVGPRNALLNAPDIFNEEGPIRIASISASRGFSLEAAQAVSWLNAGLYTVSSVPSRVVLLQNIFMELTEAFLNINGLSEDVVKGKHKALQVFAERLSERNKLKVLSRFGLVPSKRLPVKSERLGTSYELVSAKMSQDVIAMHQVAFMQASALLGESLHLWVEFFTLMSRSMTSVEALNVMGPSVALQRFKA